MATLVYRLRGYYFICSKGVFFCISGFFGFSPTLGGFSGGQAEYVRVPNVDVDPNKVPDTRTDEQSLFLSDIFPTGYRVLKMRTSNQGKLSQSGGGVRWPIRYLKAWMLGAGRVMAMTKNLNSSKNFSQQKWNAYNICCSVKVQINDELFTQCTLCKEWDLGYGQTLKFDQTIGCSLPSCSFFKILE